MATKKKMLQAAAGNAGGAGLNVEDVFSTYLYTGNGSTQTITNGIDLAGEGGLVWIKSRTEGTYGGHALFDTERGPNKVLSSSGDSGVSGTMAEVTSSSTSQDLTSFNSNGFSIGPDYYFTKNTNGEDYASWTFRKAPKFFDVVTYTGNGVSGRSISHNLGTTVGTIIIKDLSSNSWDWQVYHRSVSGYGALNNTDAWSSYTGLWNSQTPTDTQFYLGSDVTVNSNGDNYVAYLFAHNDGDGEFGPDGDADIIKCGSYTGGGSSDVSVDLGFEPSFLIAKRTDSSTYGNWYMFDSMRGWTQEDAQYLRPNTSDAEGSVKTDIVGQDSLELNSTGFTMKSQYNPVNQSGGTYIYIAIRRGTKVPESATEVFTPFQGQSSGGFVAGFPVDMFIAGYQPGGESAYPLIAPRLTAGSFLTTSSTAAESSGNAAGNWDNMTFVGNTGNESSKIAWLWKRAPGYFDAVAYTGDGTGSSGSGRAVSHNLGVAPEMIWVKQRDVSGEDWWVYHSGLDATAPENYNLLLNKTNAKSGVTGAWANTAPTDTAFFLDQSPVNASGGDFIAYLFASLPGISKVGSFTHTYGTTTNVDCGFSSGARFVLIKSSSDTGPWRVWDSTRGIVAGNDPYLHLNDTQAEITNGDLIDPYASGFAVSPNFYSETMIYYAIA